MFASAATTDTGLVRELSSARAQLANQELHIQELNHRIANSLQLAADMLVFEQLRSRDPAAQAALESSRARLVAVGELHRYLYDHVGQVTVELRPFLAGLGEAITATTGLRCDVESDATRVPGEMAQPLAMAINEIAINAAKHAYAGRPGGRLEVASRREGGQLVVTVRDEGKGFGGSGQGAGGLGMSIIAALVRELKGSLTAQDDGGARYTIRIPLPANAAGPDRSFQTWNLA
jgi:two-component sensor histidine kinase